MKKKIIGFILGQLIILVYMVFSQYAVEWYGEEVRLKTTPVDPRDALYGDYIALRYDISNIDIIKFDQIPKRGNTVYIVLKNDGSYHQLVSAHLQKPSLSEGQVMLKGRVEQIINSWDPEQNRNAQATSVRVVYGFERYYVTEGSGKEIEKKRGQFDVIIKTSNLGQHISSLSFIANNVMTQE